MNAIDLPDLALFALRILFSLNLLVLALVLRRLRRYLLEVPAPDFLKAVPSAPLAITADLLVVGLVASVLFAALGHLVIAGAWAGLTIGSIMALGSLRIQLFAVATTAAVLGHDRARWTLRFFDALRGAWRPQRITRAMATSVAVGVVEFAAFAALFRAVGLDGLSVPLAALAGLRLAAALVELPVGADRQEQVPVGQVSIPPRVSAREDLAA